MTKAKLILAGVAVIAGCSKAPIPAPGDGGNVAVRSDDPYVDAALKAVEFLRKGQNSDGGYGSIKGNPMSMVGVTALVAYSMMLSPAKLTESSSPELAKAVAFIAVKQDESGCIVDPVQNVANYNTSAGVMALARSGNPAYKDAIAKAKTYLTGIQLDEGEGVDKDDPFYGGGPYAPGKTVSDASNTGMWMDAMNELGLTPDDPAMQKALVFMQRIANNPEVNDQAWAKSPDPADAGGGVYRPAESVERTADGKEVDISKKGKRGLSGWRSYGSMTYQMFKGFIYAGLKKEDPGVSGAVTWIENNWTLDENPGIGEEGQYYYYRVFARAHRAYGERVVAGHDWAKELAGKLLALQRDDGSWVNPNGRWLEDDPALATAYALEALSIAIEELGRSE